MKTVCKKLLSLMLVAVLLVSAVPMMASAASDTISVEVYVGAESNDATYETTLTVTPNNKQSSTVVDICTWHVLKYFEENGVAYGDFAGAYVAGRGNLDRSDSVNVGDTVVIRYTAPAQTPDPTTPPTTAPTTPPTTAPTTPEAEKPINVVLKVNDSDNVVATGSVEPAKYDGYVYVKDLLTYRWNSDWQNAYNFSHAWVDGRGELGKDAKVNSGETVYIMLDSKNTSGNSGSGSGSDSGSSSKFPYSVYLHIYAKGNVGSPIKTVTLDTWTCVKDGVVTLDEVKEVVKTYYTAKTSDGIGYDGFYYSTSTTKTDYIKDENKTERINNLDDLRTQGYVHLNVWIDNYVAKSSSSSNADSTNPKTGDSIYTAVAVMGLSVTALAAVYFINKKRIAY